MMPEVNRGIEEPVGTPGPQTAVPIIGPVPDQASVPYIPQLGDFSPTGLRAYDKASREYIIALEQSSRAKARLKNSSVIDPYHVQLAVDFLNSGKRGWVARVSDIGVLLIGTGLAYVGNIIFGSSYTAKDLIFAFVPLLLGCVAYAYAWGKRNE